MVNLEKIAEQIINKLSKPCEYITDCPYYREDSSTCGASGFEVYCGQYKKRKTQGL